MSTVLVTGANGFIGRAVSEELIRQGFNVLCAVRSEFHLNGAKAVLIPDLELPINWHEYLIGVDCVIHTAARVHKKDNGNPKSFEIYCKVNKQVTLNLAQAAAENGVKRFIFLSSVGVNGYFTEPGQVFNENDIPKPHNVYSTSKYQAEQGLLAIARQTGIEVVIIRPPLVYGPGVKANFANMLNALQKQLPLPFGRINNKRSILYVGNLVSLLIRCIHHPQAANQVFLASDGNDVSTTELLMACASALGIKARLIPIPQVILSFCAKLLGKEKLAQQLCGSLQVDINKAKQLLGWQPAITMSEGLAATAAFLNKHR